MHEGILVDFRIVKQTVRDIIGEIDHKVIIPTAGKFQVQNIQSDGEEVEVVYGKKRYVFPREDCAFLPVYSSSAENLAAYIVEKLATCLPTKNLSFIQVGIDEGYGQGAWASWQKERSA
jgi:6-pyruvoyltetrahydropterin/6-carboxytetrahydropterin synthase